MYTSVIISTYNRPDALICVLESLNLQNNNSFEVVIADDGSTEATKVAIDEFRKHSNFTLKHVWQEDDGFRAAQIRNKAVAQSKGDYLIFIDGDCVTSSRFVSRHMKLSEKGYFVRGSRVMLSDLYTEEFIQSELQPSDLSITKLIYLRATNKIKRILPLIPIPLGRLRKKKEKKWYGVKTCNLGMWRKDFFAVNGFDEQYVGWGHEDADLAVRLIRNGVYRKEGVNAVTVLHLWHALNDRSQLAENVARLKVIQESKNVRADQGVSQY